MAFRKLLGKKNEKQDKSQLGNSTRHVERDTIEASWGTQDNFGEDDVSSQGLFDTCFDKFETVSQASDNPPVTKCTRSIVVEDEYHLMVTKEETEYKTKSKKPKKKGQHRSRSPMHGSAEDILEELVREVTAHRLSVSAPRSPRLRTKATATAYITEETHQQKSGQTSSDTKIAKAIEYIEQNRQEPDNNSPDLTSSIKVWAIEHEPRRESSECDTQSEYLELSLADKGSQLSLAPSEFSELSQQHPGLHKLDQDSPPDGPALERKCEDSDPGAKLGNSKLHVRFEYADLQNKPDESELGTRPEGVEENFQSKAAELDLETDEIDTSTLEPRLEDSEVKPENPPSGEEKVKGASELQAAPASLCCSVL